MRARHLASAGLAGVLLAASAAHGAPAPKPQVVDPSGDVKGGGADADLVSVLFSATKKGRVRDQMQIAITTAGTPAVNPGSSYNLRGDVSGCGTFWLYDYWDARSGGPRVVFQFDGCGSGTNTTGDPQEVVEPTVAISGSTITFSIPFKSFPAEIAKKKVTFSNLTAYTALAEPAYAGYTPADFLEEPGAQDWAVGDGTFTTS